MIADYVWVFIVGYLLYLIVSTWPYPNNPPVPPRTWLLELILIVTLLCVLWPAISTHMR